MNVMNLKNNISGRGWGMIICVVASVAGWAGIAALITTFGWAPVLVGGALLVGLATLVLTRK